VKNRLMGLAANIFFGAFVVAGAALALYLMITVVFLGREGQ